MPENVQSDAPSMASLVAGIISDAERLVRQEIALARREMQVELEKAETAGMALALGAGIAMIGAVFLCLVVVFLLHELGGLALWASFLIVGGLLAIAGGILVATAYQKVRQISLVPPQTAQTLQENAQWLQNPK
jgi:CHASE3 domain sensor protein